MQSSRLKSELLIIPKSRLSAHTERHELRRAWVTQSVVNVKLFGGDFM